MAKKKENRVVVTLACSDCKRRNYTTSKNRQKTQARLELNKYCPWDKKHTMHKEVR